MNGESSRKRLKKYFWFCKFTRRCEERRSAWVKDERWFVWWIRDFKVLKCETIIGNN
jgi:hypothetical protein